MGPLLRTLAAALALSLATPQAGLGADEAGPLVVLGAISAKAPLDDLARAYLARTGAKVTVTYDTTPALVAAVRRAGRADVLVASDPDAVSGLLREGLAAGPPVDLAGNALVVVARSDDAAPVALGPDLGDDTTALAAEDQAVGRHARAALEALGAWDAVRDGAVAVATGEDAVARVATGAARRGIAYRTDAARVPDVRIVAEFPADSHPPLSYRAAALSGAADPAGARRFMEFLESEAGPAFLRHGFPPAAPAVASTEAAGPAARQR
jgi:molybdate transport system substrate-binding protein